MDRMTIPPRSLCATRLQNDCLGEVPSPDEAAELIALAAGFVAYCARRLGAGPSSPTARP